MNRVIGGPPRQPAEPRHFHAQASLASTSGIAADHADDLAVFGELSREIGWESAMSAILDAGRELSAEAARTTWTHPRHAEVVARRLLDHRPCGRRQPCRCSRCTHASAWERHGGPFLGIEREAARRAGASLARLASLECRPSQDDGEGR